MLHLACEQGCRVLVMLITAGQAGDSPQFTAVLDAIEVAKPAGGRARVRPDRVLADKAYSRPPSTSPRSTNGSETSEGGPPGPPSLTSTQTLVFRA
ncbi:hypothetical protein ACQP0C_13525 [Nocardia sp. CA-129566]|uniref:hypothetical protein n=1 Tax=Nocardia sp. CA-129566 TaxID=3239976 RepID=UPI003D96C889